jgi:predicted alpha/beta hydrolase family esterase
MTTTLIVPGLHSSGPAHWQTWFEAHIPGSVRVIQRDWDKPDLPEWASRVRREINRIPGRIFIVAHSFGALAAVQASHDHSSRIGGAMLVAPADPEKFGIADYLPSVPLVFRSVVVASTNDPWITAERAAHWADVWGADFVSLGEAGHINVEAGFGPWPEGLALFERLRRSSAFVHDAYPLEAERAPFAELETSLAARSRSTRIHGREHVARRMLARTVG